MAAVLKTTFQTNFLVIVGVFFTERCYMGFSYQNASIGSDNGLVPHRQEAINWTNDGLVYWCVYALLCLDELWSSTFVTVMVCPIFYHIRPQNHMIWLKCTRSYSYDQILPFGYKTSVSNIKGAQQWHFELTEHTQIAWNNIWMFTLPSYYNMEKTIGHTLYSPRTPHTLTSWANYGLSLVSVSVIHETQLVYCQLVNSVYPESKYMNIFFAVMMHFNMSSIKCQQLCLRPKWVKLCIKCLPFSSDQNELNYV